MVMMNCGDVIYILLNCLENDEFFIPKQIVQRIVCKSECRLGNSDKNYVVFE